MNKTAAPMTRAALPVAPGQRPREWQLRAVRALEQAVRPRPHGEGLTSVVVSAATGAGKGTFLAGLARRVEQGGGRCLILVHRNELIRDLAARVAAIPGPPVGVVQGSDNGILAGVVVASVQTLRVRLDQLPAFSMVVTDECHHASAKTYRDIVAAVEKARGSAARPLVHVGMTATPYRAKPGGGTEGLGDVFEALIFEYGIVEAIEAGDLVPPRALRIETHVEVSSVRLTAAGDYDEKELEAALDTPGRNKLIVERWEEHARGVPTLVFATSVAHAQHLADEFKAKGHRFEPVWGTMPARERSEIIGEFKAGRILGVVSRDLLFEGFDAPRVRCLVRARPSQSRIILTQMAGRGLRKHPGKTECLILDFVDDGVPWDLSSVSDMSDPSERQKSLAGARKQYNVGDFVALRHGDRGVGQVVESLSYTAVVAWPDGEGRHGHAELRAALATELAKVPPPPVSVGLGGEFLLHLLPGQKPASAAGWYHTGEAWIAVGKNNRNGKAVAHIRQLRGGEFTGWVAQELPSTDTEGRPVVVWHAAHLGTSRDLMALQAEMEQRMRASRIVFDLSRLATDRAKQPASVKQLGALRAVGLRRSLENLSAAEASYLLSEVQARRVIADKNKETRRLYAGGGRS